MPDLDKTGPSAPAHSSRTPTLDSPEMHGLGEPEPGERHYIRQRIASRLAARTVPALRIPPVDPELGAEAEQPPEPDEESAAGIALGVGLFAGRHPHHNPATPTGPITRYYRELGPTAGVLSADGNVWINLGTAATDKLWELRDIIVFNNDPWTAGAAGALTAVFAGSFQVGSVRMSDAITPGVAIPANLFFTNDQQIVYGGQTLYVVVHTPGAATNVYSAAATVREYDWDIYRYAVGK